MCCYGMKGGRGWIGDSETETVRKIETETQKDKETLKVESKKESEI